MYLLTIYNGQRVSKLIEFNEPPTTSQIEEHLTEGMTFDISRKPIDDKDIEEYLYDDLEEIQPRETGSW